MESQLRRRYETRLAALVRHASDVVGILAADGAPELRQPVRRAAARPRRRTSSSGTPLVELVHPDDVAGGARVPRAGSRRASRAARSSASGTPTAAGATWRRWPPT